VAAKVKGAAIRELVRWYARAHGRAQLEAATRRMPAPLAAQLDPHDDALGIIASTWYDAELVHAMLDAIIAPYPAGDRSALIKTAAREAVQASMNGVYKFVIGQIVTPGFYARNIQRLWAMLHDGGCREIRIVRDGLAISRTWDWPGHHPLLCEVTIETMCAIFELTGKRDVVARRTQCVSQGASECVAEVRWR
jgi:hypothetical protein